MTFRERREALEFKLRHPAWARARDQIKALPCQTPIRTLNWPWDSVMRQRIRALPETEPVRTMPI